MNRTNRLLLCVLAAAGMAVPALAQKDAAKPDKPKAAQPEKKPAGMPEMSPEEAKMFEAYMKAATPGEMHKHLARGVGKWDGKVSMRHTPDQPAEESTCVTHIASKFDGRFVTVETKGDMPGMPMKFEGFGLYGYDNTSKKFQSTWVDNMGTGMMVGTGDLSADGRVLTWTMTFHDPATGKPTTMREVETYTSDDSMTLEMFGPGPDGKEFRMMEIKYTRKSDKGHSEGKDGDKHSDHGHDHAKDAKDNKKK